MREKEGVSFMRNFLQKCQREIIVSAILYAILGIILLVFDVKALGTIIQVLGWIFIVYAIYNFYIYFVRRDSLSSGPLLIAIPFLLIGLVMARNPGFVIGMSSILIGIVILFNGIVHIQTSLVQKDLGYTNWLISLIYSISCCQCIRSDASSGDQTVKYIIKLLKHGTDHHWDSKLNENFPGIAYG